ncbi:uncharacterized protein DNG_09926 [Cephalotrichum gorgonifer]|uniref:Extracellular serine-rich protein n=1 Tax=Cephalotrichum gorgonifer TaxID=2041049 RepID=A0AAE8T0G2_9PEZI|nr:uncharacterized protein DNG_09926 [Cephalotrichum gorgonifer]
MAAPSRFIQVGNGVSIGLGTIDLSTVLQHFAMPQVHTVVVGGPQDTFVPNTVNAKVGDTIQFQFSSGNHTVTQSAPDLACQPLQATVPGALHSGHIPFQAGQTTVGTFTMTVRNTAPMFLYCATGPHCQLGQVMVVNPTSASQVVAYNRLAVGAPANIDGTVVAGGTVGSIPIENAAFDPPAPEEEAAPGGPPAAPPAAPPAESSAAAATSAAATADPAATTTAAAA